MWGSWQGSTGHPHHLCSSAGAASQRSFSLSPMTWRDQVALGGCQAMSGGIWSWSILMEDAGKGRKWSKGRCVVPRHLLHQALPEAMGKQDLMRWMCSPSCIYKPSHLKGVQDTRRPGGSWSESFSQTCMSETSGSVLTFWGLTLSYGSAMVQSGMKDKSVGSSLAPSVPRLPAPVQAAGLSPPHHVVWHFWQSQGRQRSLGTDPAASFP